MTRKSNRSTVRIEQLAHAVVDILSEYGRGGLTRERISERSGLSRPLIYYYFDSTEAVLGSAFKWICSQLLEREEKLLGEADVGSLDQLAASFIPTGDRTRKLYRAFFALLPEAAIQDGLREELMQLRSRRRELLAQVLLEAARAGEVRPPDGCDLDAVAGLLESAALQVTLEGPRDEKNCVTQAINAVGRYLRPFQLPMPHAIAA
jgi:AcrR family transcriptional regulator